MDIILTITYTALFLLVIRKAAFFRPETLSVRLFQGVFLLKIGAGFCMLWIYTRYYTDYETSDIHRYFSDAQIIYGILPEKPWHYLQLVTGLYGDDVHLQHCLSQTSHWYKSFNHNLYNDNRTIIRFNALVMLFSFGHHYVHIVFMNFVALAGQMAVFRTFLPCAGDRKYGLLAMVFLIPSVLFWSSGVLKEGIMLFGLGFLLYHVQRLVRNGFSWPSLVWIAGTTGLLMICKIYLLLAVSPGLLSYAISVRTRPGAMLLRYLAVHAAAVLVFANIGFLIPEYDLVNTTQGKQGDFLNMEEARTAGSRIEIGVLEPTFLSLVRNTPAALVNVLFRPFPWEAAGALQWAAAAENLLVFLFIAYALFRFRRPGPMQMNAILLSASFVLFTYALIGLVTPITGAIVRYKIAALPFLLLIFLLILGRRKTVAGHLE